MNIFTIISTLSFISAFHITAKVGQSEASTEGIKMIRMIKSDEITHHCFRLLKSLIAIKSRSDISSPTMVLANKCSKIQAVRATIQKLISKQRNKYSLWWWKITFQAKNSIKLFWNFWTAFSHFFEIFSDFANFPVTFLVFSGQSLDIRVINKGFKKVKS